MPVGAACSVVFFGIDRYIEHVRDPTGNYRSSSAYTATLEYSEREARKDPSLADGVEVSVYAGHAARSAVER